MHEFAKRNKILREMGFPRYEDYQRSALYASIRKAVLAEKGTRCVSCGYPSSICHHENYLKETLNGDDVSAIWPMCSKCHGLVHFDGVRFRSLSESSKVLQAMRQGQVKLHSPSKIPAKRSKKVKKKDKLSNRQRKKVQQGLRNTNRSKRAAQIWEMKTGQKVM